MNAARILSATLALATAQAFAQVPPPSATKPAAESRFVFPNPPANRVTPAQRAELDRARAILKAWQDSDPIKARRVMRVAYWIPADGAPSPDYRERLTRTLRFTQDFYAREMEAQGYAARGIQFEVAEDGLAKFLLVRGSKPFDAYNDKSTQPIRDDVAAALLAQGIDADKETLVIFCNLCRWDPARRTIVQTSPYCASGTHAYGTAWQVDSPILDPLHIPIRNQRLTDGQYGRISLGQYNSIFVGGVVHELGHALGLPHNRETGADNQAKGTALMGSGNSTMCNDLRGEGTGTHLSIPHALRLASHPQFSGSFKDADIPLAESFADLAFKTEGDEIVVSGRVTAAVPVYAIILYADPVGGDDYDAFSGFGVPDADGRFTARVARPTDGKAEIRIVACGVNGASSNAAIPDSKNAYPISIAKGSVDFTQARMILEIGQIIDLYKAGKLPPTARAGLSPSMRQILARLDKPDSAEGKPTPATVDAAAKSIALSDCAPDDAHTGWQGPHYDRLAENRGPLVSTMGIGIHGLYAHAPATYAYSLGAKWNTFSGRCGIATGKPQGTVQFVITGDGKELWKSRVVTPEDEATFSIDVTGVDKLELQVLPTPDGNGGDWGLWLEPTLARK